MLLGIIVGAVGEVLTDVKLRMELRKQKKKIDEIKREQKIQESEVLTKPEFPLSSTIKDYIYEPPGQLKSFWNIFRGELHLRTASDPIFSSSQHLLEKLTVKKEGYPYAKEVRWVRSGMLVIYENRILMALLKEAMVPQLAPPPR